MKPDHPPAQLDWRDDALPVSRQFDDPYFSLADGLAETRHVFLDGNDLRARLQDGFQVAELGFGTGLNLLALIDLWRNLARPGRIFFTSFEAFPMSPDDMARAQMAFPQLAAIARDCAPFWQHDIWTFDLPDIRVEVIKGDARQTLPRWTGSADAWFLDGFAPAKNPELWEPALLQAVAGHTAAGGSAATYTAAGAVRRGLAEAGFEVARIAGFGRKRHMTVARKPAP